MHVAVQPRWAVGKCCSAGDDIDVVKPDLLHPQGMKLLIDVLRPVAFRAGIEGQPGGIYGNTGNVLRLARLRAAEARLRCRAMSYWTVCSRRCAASTPVAPGRESHPAPDEAVSTAGDGQLETAVRTTPRQDQSCAGERHQAGLPSTESPRVSWRPVGLS